MLSPARCFGVLQSRRRQAIAFFKANGVTIHEWSPELMARFREVAAEVMSEASAEDPAFKEACDSLQAYRAKNAGWRDIAYPR